MKKIGWFCLLFVGVGIMYWPWAKPAYEVPKIWWWRLMIVGLWIMGRKFSLRKPARELLVLFGVWIALLLPGVLFGNDVVKSVLGNYYRADGLWTMMVGMLTSIYLAVWADGTWWKMIRRGLIFVAVVEVVAALVVCRRWLLIGEVGCGGLMGHPVFLAQVIWLAVPAWWLERKDMSRFFDLIMWLVMVAGLVITGSWLGMMGVVLMIGLRVLGGRGGMVLSLVGILIVATIWMIQTKRDALVMESRERIWHKGWMAFEKKPLFGWGLANFDYAFEGVDWPIRFNDDVTVDKAHNELLEYLVTSGVAGTIGYLAIWGWVANRLRKTVEGKNKKLLIGMILVYLFLSMTNVMTGAVQMMYWIIIGMAGTNRTV